VLIGVTAQVKYLIDKPQAHSMHGYTLKATTNTTGRSVFE